MIVFCGDSNIEGNSNSNYHMGYNNRNYDERKQ